MTVRRIVLLVLALLVCVWLPAASATRIKPTPSSLLVEVGAEEVCLYSKTTDRFEGVSFRYKVLQGDNDFDVSVRGNDNRTLYASFAGEHGDEERVYFTTRRPGEHSYCIGNRMYSGSKKLVKIDIGLTSLKRFKSRIDPLNKVMGRAEGSFLGMAEDQILARIREAQLRERLEALYTLLTVRGATETALVIIMTLFNVALISRLLRRVS